MHQQQLLFYYFFEHSATEKTDVQTTEGIYKTIRRHALL